MYDCVGDALLNVVREWGAARIEVEIESLAAALDEQRATDSRNQTSDADALRVALRWLLALLVGQRNYEFVSALLALTLRVSLL